MPKASKIPLQLFLLLKRAPGSNYLTGTGKSLTIWIYRTTCYWHLFFNDKKKRSILTTVICTLSKRILMWASKKTNSERKKKMLTTTSSCFRLVLRGRRLSFFTSEYRFFFFLEKQSCLLETSLGAGPASGIWYTSGKEKTRVVYLAFIF